MRANRHYSSCLLLRALLFSVLFFFFETHARIKSVKRVYMLKDIGVLWVNLGMFIQFVITRLLLLFDNA